MSEIKRYALECNCDPGGLTESKTGDICLYSEAEDLLKEKSEQINECKQALNSAIKLSTDAAALLQQKDEEIERLKFEKTELNLEKEALKSTYEHTEKLRKELKTSLTSYRELMGRMAGALDNYLSESKKQSLVEIYSQFEQLLTDYKKLEG